VGDRGCDREGDVCPCGLGDGDHLRKSPAPTATLTHDDARAIYAARGLQADKAGQGKCRGGWGGFFPYERKVLGYGSIRVGASSKEVWRDPWGAHGGPGGTASARAHPGAAMELTPAEIARNAHAHPLSADSGAVEGHDTHLGPDPGSFHLGIAAGTYLRRQRMTERKPSSPLPTVSSPTCA
jgi:hypothetical protein